jgi:esterase/lipase superfamily enzyme
MHRSYHRWDSQALGRSMELLVFGHAGAPVIVFPTSRGRFYDYEDRGMVWSLSQHLEQGWIQLICVDSVDDESWYCEWAHPSGRLARHDQYEQYITNEVLPFGRQQNSTPFVMAHGCSFGASHAVLFGLRYPRLFQRVIALSGYYDMRNFLGGHHDEAVYYHNPVEFVAGLQPGPVLDDIRTVDIILAIGRDDTAAWTNAQLSDALWSKGVWHAMRWWDGWAHDWPYWQHMIQLYIGGPN